MLTPLKGGVLTTSANNIGVMMLMVVVSPPADNITVNNITPAVEGAGEVGEVADVPPLLAAEVAGAEPCADGQHQPSQVDQLRTPRSSAQRSAF